MSEIPEKYILFRNYTVVTNNEHYWWVKIDEPVTKETRTQLKAFGWIQKRHSRTKEEMWLLDKKTVERQSRE